MNNALLILSYGTLRSTNPGGKDYKTYNFNRFGGQKYLKTLKISGFEMFSLGPYPTISEGNGEIVVELHSVDNENHAFDSIKMMESGAGYKEKQVNVEYNGENVTATIFYYPRARLTEQVLNQKIESGDWCE